MTDETPTPAATPPEVPATDVERQRPSRKAAWLSMGAVALALMLLWLASDAPHSSDEPPPGVDEETALVGKPARLDFTLKDVNGQDVTLSSFKGKVILLNFWATWCGPCKAEIPSLVELQTQYRDDLVILGYSVDDTVDLIKPYAAKYHINYPLLLGKDREEVQDAYGPMWGIPVSVIIDRDGRVAKKHSGIATKEQFEREIKALL